MNKKEAIKEAKIAANWVKKGLTVPFVSLRKKVTNRDGWHYNYTWNISKNYEWVPVDLDAFYEELGFTKWIDGSVDLGDALERNGYAVFNNGTCVVVLGYGINDAIDLAAKNKAVVA